jgi:DNA helicase HerA-like ATPase
MNARLHLGRLLDVADVPLNLNGPGLRAHTLVVGQSGSGKSFMLGRLLEELASNSRARLLILDPNSDFVKFSEVARAVWKDLRGAFSSGDDEATFRKSWKSVGVSVLTARQAKDLALTHKKASVSAPTISWDPRYPHEVARLLDFDPRSDIAEVFSINRVTKGPLEGKQATFMDFHQAAEEQWKKSTEGGSTEQADDRLYSRTHELARFTIWPSSGTSGSVNTRVRALFSRKAMERVVSLDLGSLAEPDERLMITSSAIDTIWAEARAAWLGAMKRPIKGDKRIPVFVVIDEAHNLGSGDVQSGLARKVLDGLTRIAAEGRKYGIYLILVTQRPSRLDATLRSQCDNVCILRMNDRHEIQLIEQSFGFIPQGWVQRVSDFKQGDVLLAGGLVPRPVFAHADPRRTEEGGRNLQDAAWLT